MIKVIIIIVTFMAVNSSVSVSAQNPGSVLRDKTSVYDLASLDFNDLTITKEAWILASIAPSPTSGGMIANGMHIDGRTGTVVQSANARLAIIVNGLLTVVSVLTPTVQKTTYSYSWEVPELSRKPEGDARYSPFVRGGFVICPVNNNASGANQFEPTYLIPQEWQAFVLPALAYIRTNPKALVIGSLLNNRENAFQLLNDQNPFIAITVCQALSSTGSLDENFVRGPLAQAKEEKQAIFTLLLLRSLTQDTSAPVIAAIAKLIATTSAVDNINGIALGALAALDESSSKVAPKLGLSILTEINKKFLMLPVPDPKRQYLETIVKMAGPALSDKSLAQ